MTITFRNFWRIRKKGGVAHTVVANAVVKALIAKSNDASLKAIDTDGSFWAKRLFKRMEFVKNASNTGKVEIPNGARKEKTFHHELMH